MLVDGAFVIAGLPKFIDGGWVPFAVASVLSFASFVWLRGRRRVVDAITAGSTPVADVIASFGTERSPESPVMIFLTPDEMRVPFIAKRSWIRDRAQEERVVLLRLQRGANPTVAEQERVRIVRVAPSLTQIVATFGYMELPRIAPVLDAARAQGLDLDRDNTSFFYADPKIEDANGGEGNFAQRVFVLMQRSARPLPDDLGIPSERRVELSVRVDYNSPGTAARPTPARASETTPTLVD